MSKTHLSLAHGGPIGNTDDSEDRISVQEENPEVETSMFLVNPALPSLYPSVYELVSVTAIIEAKQL